MSATDHLEGLHAVISEGRPLVLLLGQDAWGATPQRDRILDLAFARTGLPTPADPSFLELLQARLDDEFYEWLAESYTKQPDPPWLETVSRLALNAVFTTSVNPALGRAFRTRGRDVAPVLTAQDSPVSPRNRRILHVTYLFGRAGEREGDEAPPRDVLGLHGRTALHAMPLLARLVDTTTSLGALLIDGLECRRDWLQEEGIAGVLSGFGPGQVFWFGSTKDRFEDLPVLGKLAHEGGPVVVVEERLASALTALELANKLDLETPRELYASGVVTVGDEVLKVEPATRLKVSTIASILEDSWLAPLPVLGRELEFAQFRRFHGQIEDARQAIEGLRRDFAIDRTFERELADRTIRALDSRRQDPILIHGQSASGKSVALARLAFRIREQGKYPVLLASRVSRIPAVEELDEFCLRAEEAGAEATLVICDANAPATRYADLLRGFVSRGRRVTVVGSAYRIVDDGELDEPLSGGDLLEVPAELDDVELRALSDLFEEWTGARFEPVNSAYLLPAVYRMLPNVRPTLAAGLAQEARVAEDSLRVLGRNKRSIDGASASALALALIDAGASNPRRLLEERIDHFLGAMTDAASRAIDLVMVPGKLDCRLPVSLLMRSIGGSDSLTDMATLFAGIDLFRWSDNDQDDIFIHPRLPVEAELICARRLGTAQAEVEVALRLLGNASPGAFGSSERRFVLDFIHRLGPNGPFGRRYAAQYLSLARALTQMRDRRGVGDPSLMLQEATLRRRTLRDAPDLADQNAAAILDEAREIVELALEEFGSHSSRGVRRACANLKVERAAIYGFRAVERLRSGATSDEVWQFYVAARESARSAVFAADSYFANDVSVWVPNDLLKDGQWEPERRAEYIADIWDGLERVEETHLDPAQLARFEERRVKVAQTLGDNELEAAALDALDRMGSRAGIYLQASREFFI